MGFLSHHELTGKQSVRFQPYQIVCLEYETSRLYAEVVQIVDLRQMCWVRPLILIEGITEAAGFDNQLLNFSHLYDLRQGSDLLWPLALFRAALDSEVVPLSSYLYSANRSEKLDQTNHLHFKQFVYKVWQAYQEMF